MNKQDLPKIIDLNLEKIICDISDCKNPALNNYYKCSDCVNLPCDRIRSYNCFFDDNPAKYLCMDVGWCGYICKDCKLDRWSDIVISLP